MTHVSRSRIVPFTCQQMYDLVNDVERYAEFLPFFSKSEVHHRDSNIVQATLTITAAGISKSFTTRNQLQTNKMIEIHLINGPFNHLEGFWRFDTTDTGCLIAFDLEFDLTKGILSMMIGPIFEQIANKMVDAFCERANALYALELPC